MRRMGAALPHLPRFRLRAPRFGGLKPVVARNASEGGLRGEPPPGRGGFKRCPFPIDNGRRRNHMPKTLRGDGRFARRSRQRQQGRRRAKRRHRGGAPGGAPPSASPSAAGEMRRGDAAPEAQKAATPTAWRGIYPAPPGAPLPSLLGSNSFLALGHSPAASTQLGRARVARTFRHGLLAGAARDSFSPRAGRRMG